MNAAEKAAQAKAKAEESKIIDMFHEAQSYHATYLDKWKKVQAYYDDIRRRNGGQIIYFYNPDAPKITKEEEKYLKRAIKLYLKCAKAGHADSMECLAFIYQDCLHDKKKSFKWYKEGAEHGNVTCMHNLGVCYQDGEGVKPSYTKAQYWFEREEQEKK